MWKELNIPTLAFSVPWMCFTVGSAEGEQSWLLIILRIRRVRGTVRSIGGSGAYRWLFQVNWHRRRSHSIIVDQSPVGEWTTVIWLNRLALVVNCRDTWGQIRQGVHKKPEELEPTELDKSSLLYPVGVYRTILSLYKPLVISIVTYGSKTLALFLFLVMRKTPRKHKADLYEAQDDQSTVSHQKTPTDHRWLRLLHSP